MSYFTASDGTSLFYRRWGYDYNTLADDLNSLMEHLDLRDVTLVGHSMGNGESVRYLTRHNSLRVRRLIMIAPSLPFILKTPDNPEASPAEPRPRACVHSGLIALLPYSDICVT